MAAAGGRLAAVSVRLRSAGYLRKWLILGVVIGIVAGIGAIAFTAALRWATDLFLGLAGAYTPPAPAGEGATIGSGSHLVHPWALPLIVGVGGLISGFLVFGLAPEAEGHGTDAAISAVHHDPRGIRGRVAFVKIVASAITIGSGGSAGREGPTAQISAGFGSMLARWLDLTPQDARIAVTVGIGAGIGAIFRAPLGGAVLGAEVLYREDVEADALIPSLVASIVGFAVYGAVDGFTPIFSTIGGYHFDHPAELAYYAVIGVAAGLLGRLYAWSFYGITRLTRRLPGSRMLKPAIGGLLVGTIAIAVPQVLATGYGWVQLAMSAAIMTLPLWVILILPFAKILATSLSIGSGGSGGIFGPGMVIGGFLGGAVWRLTQGLPAVPHSPAPFVVVAMIACFGSIAHAPLAVMLMVAEMTGSLEMLAPAMVAVGLATAVVGDRTIYESQLRNRSEAPAHRARFGLPLVASVPVVEAMRPPVSAIADGHLSTVPVDATLDAVIEIFATEHVTSVPVLDADSRLVGVVGTADLVGAYRKALTSSLESLTGVFPGSTLIEEEARTPSRSIGRSIADASWPAGSVIVAIQRGEQLIFPEPTSVVAEGDILTVLAPPGEELAVRRFLGASPIDQGVDETPML
jgi:H+/Cl- antiporter ClcA/CBS domain-containing protein